MRCLSLCLCATYKEEISIYRKHGQIEEEGLEDLHEQCIFRGDECSKRVIWIQVPCGQLGEETLNQGGKTIVDLQINIITHTSSLFFLLPLSPLPTFMLSFTGPNKWVSQLGVRCKWLTQLSTWLPSSVDKRTSPMAGGRGLSRTHSVMPPLQKHTPLRLPSDTTLRLLPCRPLFCLFKKEKKGRKRE